MKVLLNDNLKKLFFFKNAISGKFKKEDEKKLEIESPYGIPNNILNLYIELSKDNKVIKNLDDDDINNLIELDKYFSGSADEISEFLYNTLYEYFKYMPYNDEYYWIYLYQYPELYNICKRDNDIRKNKNFKNFPIYEFSN